MKITKQALYLYLDGAMVLYMYVNWIGGMGTNQWYIPLHVKIAGIHNFIDTSIETILEKYPMGSTQSMPISFRIHIKLFQRKLLDSFCQSQTSSYVITVSIVFSIQIAFLLLLHFMCPNCFVLIPILEMHFYYISITKISTFEFFLYWHHSDIDKII